jgi:DNA-binding MarR family transcriptional regulator
VPSAAVVPPGAPAQDVEPTARACLALDMLKASRAIAGVYNGWLRGTGLTIHQYTLLRTISGLGPLHMSQAADAMALDRTSLTRLVAPLVDGGLVEVGPARDRRVRVLAVTPAGRTALATSSAGWERAQAQLRSAMGDEAFVELQRALRQFVKTATSLEPVMDQARSRARNAALRSSRSARNSGLSSDKVSRGP